MRKRGTEAGEMRRDDDNWHEIAWLRHGLNIPATNDQKEYDE